LLKRILIALLVLIVLAVAGLAVSRPEFKRWGATPEEAGRRLPGDLIAGSHAGGFTHAITINAPPAKVWPWVIQIGYRRAGWYTYDWFYQLTGSDSFVDGHSSNRIVRELQGLKVGDEIRIAPKVAFKVVRLDRPYLMLLSASKARISWLWYLQDAGDGKTRLIERYRSPAPRGFLADLPNALILDPGAWVFSSKHLQGVKQRAESHR
jgi:hypothetical protein